MNNLTHAQTERFGKLGEEMCEAGQVLGKIHVHGTHPSCENIQYNNIADLEREIGDVLNAIDLLVAGGDINMDNVNFHRNKKRKSIFKYLAHQQGIVLPMKIQSLKTQEVDFIPKILEDGIIYVSRKYGTAIHLCACGCGIKTVTPFEGPNSWTLTDGPNGSITLHPSIGNQQLPCKSHYWIINGIVKEC